MTDTVIIVQERKERMLNEVSSFAAGFHWQFVILLLDGYPVGWKQEFNVNSFISISISLLVHNSCTLQEIHQIDSIPELIVSQFNLKIGRINHLLSRVITTELLAAWSDIFGSSIYEKVMSRVYLFHLMWWNANGHTTVTNVSYFVHFIVYNFPWKWCGPCKYYNTATLIWWKA